MSNETMGQEWLDEPMSGEPQNTPSTNDEAGASHDDNPSDDGNPSPSGGETADKGGLPFDDGFIASILRQNAESQRKLDEFERGKGQADAPPNIDEFDDWGAYQKAVDEYNRNAIKAEILAEMQAEQAQKAEIQAQAEFVQTLDELKRDGVDMDTVMQQAEKLPTLPVTLDKFGLSTKETMLLAKDLVENPKLYYELAQMNPVQMAMRMVAMIEQRKATPTPPKQSKAPPPITPVTASGTATKDPNNMSDDDWYRQQTKNRHR